MADPYHHAVSSAKQWGGSPEDYLHIHRWFDEPKGWFCDVRQRAIRHHAEGIAEAIERFDTVSFHLGECHSWPHHHGCKLKRVPVRWVAEQHVMEDLGRIPTAADWLRLLPLEPWMARSRKLSRED